jgi:hypothetical protein
MAVDAFIWFDKPGVSDKPIGETKDAYYNNKGAFQIEDFYFGVEKDLPGQEFLQFKFGTVFTTKIDWMRMADETVEEVITFVYGKLGILYTPQDQKGRQGKSIPVGWDQVRNRDAHDFVSGPA